MHQHIDGDDEMDDQMNGDMDDEMLVAMQQAIQDSQDCHAICMETVMYCLSLGGEHAEVEHIGVLLDCQEICQASANFMLRESDLHLQVCEICAEACDRCAAECQRFGDDEQMQACAEACIACAESCRQMTSLTM